MIHNILALVGSSGAGKTTISLAMQRAGIPSVVSYTTRPLRPGETNGVEHHFISEADADQLLQQHSVAAYTEFGGYRYFVLFRQLCYIQDEIRSSRVTNIRVATYVIDERGLVQLLDNVNKANRKNLRNQYNVIPIYITRDEGLRQSQCDEQRLSRDSDRTVLNPRDYLLHIYNDAPDLHALESWSYAFAAAMAATFYSLGDKTIHHATLRTSDSSVANIINRIKNIQMASL